MGNDKQLCLETHRLAAYSCVCVLMRPNLTRMINGGMPLAVLGILMQPVFDAAWL